MPSMNCAPRPAPCRCSPSAMHSPSPPSRTGTPGSSAATRSTIGKSCQRGDIDRADRPGRQMDRTRGGDADAPNRRVPCVVSVISCFGHRPDRLGVAVRGRHASRCAPTHPSESTKPTAIFVPPTSMARVRSAISAGGCCRAGADRRDVRSRGEFDQRGAAGVQPHPECAAAGGRPQMAAITRPDVVQRGRRCGRSASRGLEAAPRSATGCARGSRRPRRRRRRRRR